MSERSSRQNFLGADSERIIGDCHVTVIGNGGGGSHVVQQLAHVGFRHYKLIDPDVVEESNLNRLVGATLADVRSRTPKVQAAERLIRNLVDDAVITKLQDRWQVNPGLIVGSDLVFSCIDGLAERRDLEAECRRWNVPMIDIGMVVTPSKEGPPYLSGQVIISMPGFSCMKCMGFLTDDAIAKEVLNYGVAGPRPQVVWANGVLASTAVGLAIDLITDWTRSLRRPVYLEYRGNEAILAPHHRVSALPKACKHYPLSASGSVRFESI